MRKFRFRAMKPRKRKSRYYVVQLPEREWQFSYSAKALQQELTDRIAGQAIRSVSVELEGYRKARGWPCADDFTYLGGRILLLFDRTAIELDIFSEGVIKYRWFSAEEIDVQSVFDYLPEDMNRSDRYFHEITAIRALQRHYSSKTVRAVTVEGTELCGYYPRGFDTALAGAAADRSDLPLVISFCTDSCSLRFIGDPYEYYWFDWDAPEFRTGQ